MSAFGSGAILGFASRLLFGPAHHVDYTHVQKLDNGAKHISVFVRKETFKTAWRGASKRPRIYDEYCKAAVNDKYLTEHILQPIKDIRTGGVNCDGHRIVPVNGDGHVIMADGRVYDPDTKQFHTGRDTRIQGHCTLRPSVRNQINMIMSSPAIAARLVVVLALSAIIDTGVYEVGKYNAYREVSKGKIPKKMLKNAGEKHTPGDTHMVLSQISPIPLTVKPLTQTKTDFVTPTQAQIGQLREQIAFTQSSSQQSPIIA